MANDLVNTTNLHYGHVQMAKRPPNMVGQIGMPTIMPNAQAYGPTLQASNQGPTMYQNMDTRTQLKLPGNYLGGTTMKLCSTCLS